MLILYPEAAYLKDDINDVRILFYGYKDKEKVQDEVRRLVEYRHDHTGLFTSGNGSDIARQWWVSEKKRYRWERFTVPVCKHSCITGTGLLVSETGKDILTMCPGGTGPVLYRFSRSILLLGLIETRIWSRVMFFTMD